MADPSKGGSPMSPQPKQTKAGTTGGVVEKVTETVKDVAAAAGDAAGQAKDKVQEWSSTAFTQVKDTTQELAGAASDKAADFGKDVAALIRRYPLPALLVGFGAGLLLGRVLGHGTRT